ncbi:uncharacterized protein A4U43_C07F29100 [Asparagus officinalis]|uniref:Uncharacterized protein n=1 Tax=Asparagus officinalis TaxID=4686 RepID=A0A5P1EG27_ASPOF|nr:uncharacterized protein A4U43_C07F29100 [Asparagus officinalis]
MGHWYKQTQESGSWASGLTRTISTLSAGLVADAKRPGGELGAASPFGRRRGEVVLEAEGAERRKKRPRTGAAGLQVAAARGSGGGAREGLVAGGGSDRG